MIPVTINRVKPNLKAVIWSDAEGYFTYLPGVFDLGSVHKIQPGSMWPVTNEKGEMLVKYTCGVAYFQLPFFLAAKTWCHFRGIPTADIYNKHYCYAVMLAGLCACFIGLFFLQKILRRHGFNELIIFLTVLAVLGGTNLFHYTTREMGMSHVYNFMLFALFTWQVPRFLERPNAGRSIVLALLFGWIALIRPTNGLLALIIFLLYDVYSWSDLRQRLRFIAQRVRLLPLMALCAALVWLPQLLYWHEMTGHWLYYSYHDEGFPFWKKPKIPAVLLDPQNGLLLYSPIVLLSIAGFLFRPRKDQGILNLVLFTVATYIFASWWAWWFGAAFGHRCYIELYAVLAIPMAGAIRAIVYHKSPLLRYSGIGLIVFLVFYGVRMSYLYTSMPMPWDGPEWRWNWSKMTWIWHYLFRSY